jgi:hypothetical protein
LTRRVIAVYLYLKPASSHMPVKPSPRVQLRRCRPSPHGTYSTPGKTAWRRAYPSYPRAQVPRRRKHSCLRSSALRGTHEALLNEAPEANPVRLGGSRSMQARDSISVNLGNPGRGPTPVPPRRPTTTTCCPGFASFPAFWGRRFAGCRSWVPPLNQRL